MGGGIDSLSGCDFIDVLGVRSLVHLIAVEAKTQLHNLSAASLRIVECWAGKSSQVAQTHIATLLLVVSPWTEVSNQASEEQAV